MVKYCPYCGEQIFQQTKNGFQCPNCQLWTHYASSPAVSIAVKVGKEGLVAVRGKNPGIGKQDLVGGFLEYGEDPLIGAVREFKEETGFEIDVKKLEFLGMWIDTYHYQNQDQMIFNIVYLIELPEKIELKAADDVAELIWMNLTDTPNFAFPYLYKVWDKIRD